MSMDMVGNVGFFGSILPAAEVLSKPTMLDTLPVIRDVVVNTQSSTLLKHNKDGIGRLARSKHQVTVEKQSHESVFLQINSSMFETESQGGGNHYFFSQEHEEENSQSEDRIVPSSIDILTKSGKQMAHFLEVNKQEYCFSPESFHDIEESLVTAFLPFHVPIYLH